MNKIAILKAENIKKSFKDVAALKDLNLSIKQGEILGLLGENGAGKSTAISILTADLKADSGEIYYKEKSLATCKKEYQSKLGYVPQEIALFYDLNCYQNLKFWAKVYQIDKSAIDARIKQVAETFEISDVLKRKPDTLSGGYQRRLNIACAVLHKPEILFLDEPTVGIDVSIRKSILKTIRSFTDDGMAILYTSHYIDELEEIADSVLMIKQGTELAYLNRADFQDRSLEEIYLTACEEGKNEKN